MDAAAKMEEVSDDTVKGLGGDLEKKMLLSKKDEEEHMKTLEDYLAEGYTLLVRETPLDPKEVMEWRNEWRNRPRPKKKPQPQQLEVAQCPTGPSRPPPGRSMVTPGVYNRLTDSL